MNLLLVGAALAVAVVALGALAAANRAPDAPAPPPPSLAAAARHLLRPRFAQYTPRGRAFARAAFALMWATLALVVFWFFQ